MHHLVTHIYIFFNGNASEEGWTATSTYGPTRKRRLERKVYKAPDLKNPKDEMYLFPLKL